MTSAANKNPLRHLAPSDMRGVAQLATQATTGVARIAEGVHQAVWSTLGAPGGKTPGTTRGITGLVYQSVRRVSRLLGTGLEKCLTQLEPLFASAQAAQPETPQREAILAALNGVMGDRLAAGSNSLTTPMTLRLHGKAFDWNAPPNGAEVSGKVLLLLHGLCMNDLQWQAPPDTAGNNKPAKADAPHKVNHAAVLASSLGYTPVYVRYNSGLHISENGLELSEQLDQLVRHWPRPVEEITVLAHSMGGLVIRSAVHRARQQKLHWPAQLRNIVFLGTPHHGAPLERAGNWVDVLLGSTPYSAPFARLAQLRSAGITDLRYGHVLEEDWLDHDRFRRKPDSRRPVPLPAGIRCFAVAATMAAKRSLLAERLTGDGLVPLRSALGQHDDARRSLEFAKSAQWIAYRMNHMQLLHSPEVSAQISRWLVPAAA